MSINSVLATGVQGVQRGMQQATESANTIAKTSANGDTNGMTTAIVDLMQSEIQVKASASVIRTADAMMGTLIDTFA